MCVHGVDTSLNAILYEIIKLFLILLQFASGHSSWWDLILVFSSLERIACLTISSSGLSSLTLACLVLSCALFLIILLVFFIVVSILNIMIFLICRLIMHVLQHLCHTDSRTLLFACIILLGCIGIRLSIGVRIGHDEVLLRVEARFVHIVNVGDRLRHVFGCVP